MPNSQQKYSNQSYLGLDFGTKRVGIAVGQAITRTASPLSTLNRTDQTAFWQALSQIIREWQPQALIMGLPLQLDGSPSKTSEAARKFGLRLQKEFALPVYFIDEHLTSVSARERLRDALPVRQQSRDKDAMAAAIILESWFNDNIKESFHYDPSPSTI